MKFKYSMDPKEKSIYVEKYTEMPRDKLFNMREIQ